MLALNAGRRKDIQAWAAAGAPLGRATATPEEALRVVLAWLSHRPGVRSRVTRVTVEVPPGIAGDIGWWLCLDLTGVPAASSVEVSAGMRRSYHGTSFEVLHRVLACGLQTGWSKNTDGHQELRGIWSLAPERAFLLQSYVLYTCLDDSGYMFGPMLELRSPEIDPRGRKVVLKRRQRQRNRDQWLSYDDTTSVVRCWIHVLHIAEMSAAPADAGFSIFAEGRLHPELEVHPETSWDELRRLSEASQDDVV